MMRSNKKLPPALLKKQESQRQETINKVLRSLADIKNEGKQVTITVLVEYTGLSRSVFAKQHIREMLVEHGYVSGNAVVPYKCKKTKQSEIVAQKDRLIAELRVNNAGLEQECELLRGRLFLAMLR